MADQTARHLDTVAGFDRDLEALRSMLPHVHHLDRDALHRRIATLEVKRSTFVQLHSRKLAFERRMADLDEERAAAERDEIIRPQVSPCDELEKYESLMANGQQAAAAILMREKGRLVRAQDVRRRREHATLEALFDAPNPSPPPKAA